ncbi:hypothetical protein RO3G_00935 [Lichtheimia corymbifera JMRC:FSU:9682]|uniref:Myb-like domain-containing protein n=1 Tax=Lichtheimia corymbifera JMRC:FSU:9682 TaxID=1263082 RepID=A0A068S9W5_9FUNG|nr:hypothetical protein RO3G_00935 [Lichtheimia corymbifera JMRC:FSU:9682]
MDIKNLLCPSQHNTNTMLPIDDDDYSIYPGVVQQQPNWSSTLSLPELEDNGSSPAMSFVKSSPASFNTATLSSPPPGSPIIPPLPTYPTLRRQHKGAQSRVPWTREEDELLQRGYNQGLSWAMISSTYLPHRSRGCCWGRFKTLQTKTIEHREWDDNEDALLDMALRKHADLFKHAWKLVSHELGTKRSWRECESRSIKLSSGHMIRKRHLY